MEHLVCKTDVSLDSAHSWQLLTKFQKTPLLFSNLISALGGSILLSTDELQKPKEKIKLNSTIIQRLFFVCVCAVGFFKLLTFDKCALS